MSKHGCTDTKYTDETTETEADAEEETNAEADDQSPALAPGHEAASAAEGGGGHSGSEEERASGWCCCSCCVSWERDWKGAGCDVEKGGEGAGDLSSSRCFNTPPRICWPLKASRQTARQAQKKM